MKKLEWPARFAARGSILLRKFPKLRLMVAGDLVADEILYGDTERISREAPILILRYDRTELVPGGAGNAANNGAELGAQAVPLGVVGDDPAGQELLRYFRMKKVDLSGVLALKNRPTTVKTRILAGAHHTAKQQVLRIDRFEDKEISRAVESKLIGRVTALAPKCDALLIADYGLGVLTEGLRRSLLSAFAGKTVTVDSRYHLADYRGATLLTPNLSEAGPAAGVEIHDGESLARAGDMLRKKMDCRVLITRGPQGMSLFDLDGAVTHLPVFGMDQPVDPTGAGDTVAVTATLALAAGADLPLAGALSSVAAGLAVAKRGTATVTVAEILQALRGSQG